MQLFKISTWGFCTTTDQQGVARTEDIKNAMVQYGPIGTGVAAGSDWDNVGPGSVISGRSTNIDHDVVLVGWDDSKGNGGAWIMRNSWGTGWGDLGYAFIAYGADSVGSEAIWCAANVVLPPMISWILG
jgi:cathepsin L